VNGEEQFQLQMTFSLILFAFWWFGLWTLKVTTFLHYSPVISQLLCSGKKLLLINCSY